MDSSADARWKIPRRRPARSAEQQSPKRERGVITPLGNKPVAHARGSDQMLDLHKQLAAAKTPADKTAIQRQIDATDRQIDQLVYELYGLTDEEIAIVDAEGQ